MVSSVTSFNVERRSNALHRTGSADFQFVRNRWLSLWQRIRTRAWIDLLLVRVAGNFSAFPLHLE